MHLRRVSTDGRNVVDGLYHGHGRAGRRRRDRHARRRHHGGRSRSRSRSTTNSEDAALEYQDKQELLLELENLAKKGVRLSFVPTLEDPVYKLRFEYERHLTQQTLVDRVTFIKNLLKIGATMIEMAAGYFLPWLRLQGWAAYLAEQVDSGRYDDALENIWRIIFKKGLPNPFLQVGLLVLGSAFMFHFGGGSGPRTGQGGAGSATPVANGGGGGGGGFMNVVGPLIGQIFTGGGGGPIGGGGGGGNGAPPSNDGGGGFNFSTVANFANMFGGSVAPQRVTPYGNPVPPQPYSAPTIRAPVAAPGPPQPRASPSTPQNVYAAPAPLAMPDP